MSVKRVGQKKDKSPVRFSLGDRFICFFTPIKVGVILFTIAVLLECLVLYFAQRVDNALQVLKYVHQSGIKSNAFDLKGIPSELVFIYHYQTAITCAIFVTAIVLCVCYALMYHFVLLPNARKKYEQPNF